MYKRIFSVLICIFFAATAVSAQRLRSTTVQPANSSPVITGVEGLEGVWEDLETHNLHTIKKTPSGFTVESVINFGNDGTMVEKMNLVLNEWKDGGLKWGYFTPSTGYHVNFEAVKVINDQLVINWNNDDGKGKTLKGTETLHRMMSSVTKNSAGVRPVAVTPGKPAVAGEDLSKRLFGKIYKINGSDIIVASRTPGSVLQMGDTVFAMINGEKVVLDVVFPMQTVTKCRVQAKSSKYKDQLTLNSEVYK